jgi:hypothetical protein
MTPREYRVLPARFGVKTMACLAERHYFGPTPSSTSHVL